MKKTLFTLCLLFFMSVSLHAQDAFFNDSLRKQLYQLLVDINIAIPTEISNYNPLIIRNLITMESIMDNPTFGEDKYGIYDFRDKGHLYAFSLILIKRGDKYVILDIINKSRTEIKREMKSYFCRHPEVPKELFPSYMDALNHVRKEFSHLKKVWSIRIEKDRSNNLGYRYIDKFSGKTIEFEEIID